MCRNKPFEKELWYLELAEHISKRSTCARRKVGCVLINEYGHIVATGYNGVASGLPHCNEGNECVGATAASGTRLDECLAIHAEQNALLQCRNTMEITTCFVTTSPCMHCIKMLMNTSCKLIVAGVIYDHEAVRLWVASGKHFILHNGSETAYVDYKSQARISRSPAGLDKLR